MSGASSERLSTSILQLTPTQLSVGLDRYPIAECFGTATAALEAFAALNPKLADACGGGSALPLPHGRDRGGGNLVF